MNIIVPFVLSLAKGIAATTRCSPTETPLGKTAATAPAAKKPGSRTSRLFSGATPWERRKARTVDEDERPLTREEMQAGIEAYRKQRGRPVGSDKELTTIRFDHDILAAFRAGGLGWQTRMNAALNDWLRNHILP